MFEVPPEETVGKLVYDLGTHQWDIPALRAILSDVVENNSAFQDFEVEHDFDGLGPRIMLLNAPRIDGSPGRTADPPRHGGHHRAPRGRQQREAARVEAETANRTKDEFIATLSTSCGRRCMPCSGGPRCSGGATTSRAWSRRVSRSSSEHTSAGQAHRGFAGHLTDHKRRHDAELAPVDLGEVIAAAVEAVRPAADAKGTQLSLRLDARAGLITGDRDRLQQVVWNLLNNAIKFAPGGTVEVGLDRADAGARITVQDNGMGIVPDALPYIFDRFRQAHSGIARVHGGLGLGLAIVRHIVSMLGAGKGREPRGRSGGNVHGGASVRGRPRRVGIFHGRIQGVAPPGRSTASAHGAPRLDGLHALIVEDERDSSELLVRLLEGYGARVTAVASVAEALAALEPDRPNVLIVTSACRQRTGTR